MLPIDNDIREKVLTQEGNVVISASAGTGKTYTTVMRIKRDSKENKTFQTFAAITFTRKAAKEISNRLGPNRGDGFVGTNDNFVWSEIIQPFMYDIYGTDFKKDIKPDFSNENQISDFNEGVAKIQNTQFMCKYNDNKKNFAFQLALEIVKNSHSARRFMKAKYYRIYIDEYQDSDIDMHKFFMYLCDVLEIPLFIVGDAKQSIYGWRGAYSRGFTGLFEKERFTRFVLRHNFRSNKAIQNYSNIFMDSVREYYRPIDFNNEVILYKYTDKDDASYYIKEWLNLDEKCAMLNFSNDDAKSWCERLNATGLDFVYIPSSPLDYATMESEHIWIARSIANFILKHRYSEYDFRDEIPIPDDFKVFMLKTKLNIIKDSIEENEVFYGCCYSLYNYLGYDIVTEKIEYEVELLYDVVIDEKYVATYNQDRCKLTSGTIHSSKGLEFNQVIINAVNYDFERPDIKFLHYVAVSRPEERLLILAKNEYIKKRYLGHINHAVLSTSSLGFDIEIENVIKVIK
ncbi:Superfamily I DNA or RNA helicase [Tindallia californiensis]|uniref:Superfamily I DNA or RNA helicase n=1 Tax=Tindallia californiensis TaxID=159292 RepID=A0A1H3P518_9FIRM|nr:Superfamily I DNA or RNA helicase [Tindallia californiensis]